MNKSNSFYSKLIFISFLMLWNETKGQNFNLRNFDLLDEEDGLSNHWITDVVQDSMGFIWIGTKDGLNRFDGHQFKIFRNKASDSTSLPGDYGQFLALDSHGKLWTSVEDGKISRFDYKCQCFETFQLNLDPKSQYSGAGVRILRIEEGGIVWYSQSEIGLNILNVMTGEFRQFDLPVMDSQYSKNAQQYSNAVSAIYRSDDGLYWLASTNGLYTFNANNSVFNYIALHKSDSNTFRNDKFLSILNDGQKGFWLPAWGGGLFYYDRVNNQFFNYKYDIIDETKSIGNIIKNVAEKDVDELWVATTDRGVGVFNKKNKKFRFFNADSLNNSLGISKTTEKIVYLKTGVLFYSTIDGLVKYDPNKELFTFKKLKIASSQLKDRFFIPKIIEDTLSQSIFFATSFGNGLNVLDLNTHKMVSHQIEIDPNKENSFIKMSDIIIDKSSRIWVIGFYTIYQYDRKSKKLIKFIEAKNYYGKNKLNSFKKIIEDKDGDLWVLTHFGGVHQIDIQNKKLGNNIIDFLDEKQEFYISDFSCDSLNHFWYVIDKNIAYFNKTSKTFSFPKNPDIEKWLDEGIYTSVMDRSGALWVSNIKLGLLKISLSPNAEIETMRIAEEDGLPTKKIFSMACDYRGDIWMATIKGVVYFDQKSRTYRVFNYSNGIEKNTSYMKFFNGYNESFYITVPGKYAKVNFENISIKQNDPTLYIDKISILNNDRIISFSDHKLVELSPGENYLNFDFGCIDYSNQEDYHFAYILEGWDEDWIHCGKRRTAAYNNLSGGNYVFKVKQAGIDGTWGVPVSIPLHIQTPFYKQYWFLTGLAFLGAIFIYGLYYLRIKQIKQAEYQKTEFNRQLNDMRMEALRAQMNPHFIFNCLNSINRYIIKNDIKSSSLYLTRFAKLIRLILDNSANKSIVLSKEIEALQLYIEMEVFRFENKFSFDITVDPEVDIDNIVIPPLILQPYIENAIWHGLLPKETGGHLSVSIRQNDDYLICEIMDNGIGRKKAMEYNSINSPTRKSIGMKLTEERLKYSTDHITASGSQEIIDLYDEMHQAIGTKVILTIPV